MDRLPTFPDKYDEVQRAVLKDFRLDLMGPHGLPHWSRVYRNGLLIAKMDDRVDLEIVTLFALLHDSQRWDEYADKLHGVRGQAFAAELAPTAMPYLSRERLTLLRAAILDHPNGFLINRGDPGGVTIQACWDADRLDLGRVGIKPDPARMGSRYGQLPGITDLHWEEAWNAEGMEAMIEAV